MKHDAAQLEQISGRYLRYRYVAKLSMDVIEAILNKGLPYASDPVALLKTYCTGTGLLGASGTRQNDHSLHAGMGLGIYRPCARLSSSAAYRKTSAFPPACRLATYKTEQQIAVFRYRSR